LFHADPFVEAKRVAWNSGGCVFAAYQLSIEPVQVRGILPPDTQSKCVGFSCVIPVDLCGTGHPNLHHI